LAGTAIDGAGAGNSGVLVTAALWPLGAELDGVAAEAAGVAGAGTGATIAVKGAISATLRNCFRESMATGRAADGAGEVPDVELPNIDRIIDSALCADDAGVTGTVGSAGAGIVTEAGEGLIDSDDVPPSIDWIIDSPTCVPASAAAGVVIEAGEGLIDSDDVPPNIDLIIDSASCAGDAVVTGLFTVFAIAWGGA
jgi:hypothetical protein